MPWTAGDEPVADPQSKQAVSVGATLLRRCWGSNSPDGLDSKRPETEGTCRCSSCVPCTWWPGMYLLGLCFEP